MVSKTCPLCPEPKAEQRLRTLGRTYFRCGGCDLLFVGPGDRPTRAEERDHYRSHRNDPTDGAYRDFLDRLLKPLCEKLTAGAEGIDFGSGPGPTASVMLVERGPPTALYDPFFSPDRSVLEKRYDFLTCSETAEHFHDPAASWSLIDRLVRPGGWVGVMTEMTDRRLSEDWWYLRDPTHVCFYSVQTMAWIGRRFGWRLETPHKNVVLFHKPA